MRLVNAVFALLLAVGCASQNDQKQTIPARDVTQYSVAEFYANASVFGSSFSRDKQNILVTSNASGVYNAYAIPVGGGAPLPLTTSTTNSVFAISYFPLDMRLLYSSDQGGNELAHVYVRLLDGTTKDLTPGTKHRASFDGWAGDDKHFWISTNERDQRYFDVYEYGVTDLKRMLVYQNTTGFDTGPISRDGRYFALGKSLGSSNTDVYLYDRRTKQTKNLTAHTGAVANRAVTFSPDGTRLLIVTDESREFAALKAIELATGALTTVLEPTWDVVGASYSESGKYLSVAVNQDARITVQTYEAAGLKPASTAVLPAGLGLSGEAQFSRDDSLVAFYAEDGAGPQDLFVGQFGGPPKQLTHTLNPKIKAADLVTPAVVRFKSYDSLEIPGILYRPHQASTSSKAPALVMVHGGPGGQAQIGYNPIAQSLANHGYTIFDINNRGSSGYGKTFSAMDNRKHGEADLGDVVASKRMFAALGYVDSTKIGILGGSYGGYMTLAALTLAPGEFKVGVDLFGISNWVRTLTSIPPWWTSFRQALYDEMGDPAADSVRLYRISPLFHADKINVPLMVLQGANDPRVLPKESDDIVAAAKKNGVPVEYIVFPDEGHGFVKRGNEIRGYTAIIEFLDKYLKTAH